MLGNKKRWTCVDSVHYKKGFEEGFEIYAGGSDTTASSQVIDELCSKLENSGKWMELQ